MMAEQNKYKRLGINTIFTFIGNVGPQFVSFLLVPFYTYWLSKEDFGIQDIILTYIVFVTPYLSLGLYEAVFLFPKDKPIAEQRKYLTTAINTVTLAVLFFLSLWFLLPSSIHELVLPGRMMEFEPYLIIALISGPYQRIMQNFARGLDKMRVYSITGVIHALIVLVISLTVVPYYGLAGFFVSFLTAQIVSTIYTFIGVRGWQYYNMCVPEKGTFKAMLNYSLPFVPNATMWWVVNSINRPIMLNTVGLEEVGIYSVAGKFPSIINILFTVFFSALQISVIEEFGKKSYSSFYNNVFRIIFIFLLSIVFFFVLFGDWVFELLVDEKFYIAAYYVPLLCFGAVIASLSAYVGSTFTVLKKSIYFLYSSLLAAVVALIANLLLIPKYGLIGACLALCLSQLSMFLYRWYKSYKYVNFENSIRLTIITIVVLLTLFCYYVMTNSMLKIGIQITLFLCFIVCNLDLLKLAKERVFAFSIRKK